MPRRVPRSGVCKAVGAPTPQRVRSATVRRPEQLDQVSGRVRKEDLPSAGARDHLAAEGKACGAKSGDLGIEILNDELNPVTAGLGRVVGGGARAGAGSPGEQE